MKNSPRPIILLAAVLAIGLMQAGPLARAASEPRFVPLVTTVRARSRAVLDAVSSVLGTVIA